MIFHVDFEMQFILLISFKGLCAQNLVSSSTGLANTDIKC